MHDPVRKILESKGRTVWCVPRHCTVRDAAIKMRDYDVGALIVVAEDRPVGLVSERDITTKVIAADKSPERTWVYEVMTHGPIAISPETSIEEAMAVVSATRCRHLPVMAGGEMVGLISARDLTDWMVRDQAWQISDLVSYIAGRA